MARAEADGPPVGSPVTGPAAAGSPEGPHPSAPPGGNPATTAPGAVTDEEPSGHILMELGFGVTREGGEAYGSGPIVPHVWVPGTTHLRTSVLAAWTDTMTGYLAIDGLGPRVPVTIELDVQSYRPLPADGTILAAGRVLKAGQAVVVATVDFTDRGGDPVAVGTASFMAAPNPELRLPPSVTGHRTLRPSTRRLRAPFAERAGCERREPGVAVLRRSEDGLNASHTLNGGLVTLAVEEAALSAAPPGATLSSMALRYLRPVRVGPAVARADVRAGLARVEVRDAGSDDRLAIVATTRTFTPT